jgi:glycosyltransferase involved in cell wall biosynthesis
MIIGFDAKRAFSNKSGLGNYSRDIIRGLQNLYSENQYHLFTPNAETSLLETQYQKNIVEPKGIYKLFPSFWRSVKMGNDINLLKPDIFHGLSNELPANITKCKCAKIVTIHDLIFKKLPNLYPAADRHIYDKKFRFACNAADKIIAVSNQTKMDIIEFYNIPEEKIEVVYQTCNKIFDQKSSNADLQKVKQKYNLPDEFLLNVGTIEKRKNALNIVKALYYFDIKVPLVLIGRKTPYFKEVEKYAIEHNIKDRLIVPDSVPNEDLPAIYQMAKVFIYPSVYEGFGIPVIEAQMSGTPVITSEYGSTLEASGGAALLINPLNPKSIGIAIKAVFDSARIRNELRDKGFENVEKFYSEKVTNRLIQIYKGVIGALAG